MGTESIYWAAVFPRAPLNDDVARASEKVCAGLPGLEEKTRQRNKAGSASDQKKDAAEPDEANPRKAQGCRIVHAFVRKPRSLHDKMATCQFADPVKTSKGGS